MIPFIVIQVSDGLSASIYYKTRGKYPFYPQKTWLGQLVYRRDGRGIEGVPEGIKGTSAGIKGVPGCLKGAPARQ